MSDEFEWPADAEVTNGDEAFELERATFEDGTTARIFYEEYQQDCDPRTNYENVGTMVYFGQHGYLWGDKQDNRILDDFSPEEAIEEYAAPGDVAILIPLRFVALQYDSTVSAVAPAEANGLIYADESTVIREWGLGDKERTAIERARDHLEGEIKEYAEYLAGNVYRWQVEHPNPGVSGDSCGGYIGDLDDVRAEALRAARVAQEEHRKELAEWAARGVPTAA